MAGTGVEGVLWEFWQQEQWRSPSSQGGAAGAVVGVTGGGRHSVGNRGFQQGPKDPQPSSGVGGSGSIVGSCVGVTLWWKYWQLLD